MNSIIPAPFANDTALIIPTNQYLGGGTSATTAISAFGSTGNNVTWVPAKYETGAVVDKKFFPTCIGTPPNGTDGSVRPYFQEAYAVSDIAISNAFPAYAFPNWYSNGIKVEAPQIRETVILDSDLDPVTNPGLLVASPTLYRYPGTVGVNDTGIAADHPTFQYAGTCYWDGKNLTLASKNGYAVEYNTSGGVPSTAYTGSIPLSNTALVSFRFVNGTQKGPTYGVKVTFDTSVTPPAPPASFNNKFPTIQYDTWNDSGTTMPPTGWEETKGVAYRWTYGATTPADPTPQTKTLAAVGTRITGRFLPTPLVSGVLKTVAYRYGWQISSVTTTNITVKIGKATASWSATNQQLTLSTQTAGTTIKYSLDGSTPSLTYSAPIDLTTTTTVKFFATKAGVSDSDTFTSTVTYDGVNPPADFSTDFLTALTTTPIATTQWALLNFMRKPTFYASPTGSGDGLSTSSPANLWSLLGTSTSTGKARGAANVRSYYTNSTPSLTFGITNMSGIDVYYGIGGAPSTKYTTTITPSGSQTIQYELRQPDGTTVMSDVFKWVRRTGTDGITVDWNATTKLLTLSGVPSDIRIACDALASPVAEYLAPILVTATTVFKLKMTSTVGATDVGTVTSIDPNATASFTETVNLTWTNASINVDNTRAPDVIWCSAGTYDYPTDTDKYINDGVEIYGGFSSDYTIRDRTNNESIFIPNFTITPYKYIYFYGGIIDGFTWNVDLNNVTNTSYSYTILNNFTSPYQGSVRYCKLNITYSGSNLNGKAVSVSFGAGAHMHACETTINTANINLSVGIYAEARATNCTFNATMTAYSPSEALTESALYLTIPALFSSTATVHQNSYVPTQYRASNTSFQVSGMIVDSAVIAHLHSTDGSSSCGSNINIQGIVLNSTLDLSAVAGATTFGGGGVSYCNTTIGGRIIDSALKSYVSLGQYQFMGTPSPNYAVLTTYGFAGSSTVDFTGVSTGCTAASWFDNRSFAGTPSTELPEVTQLTESIGAGAVAGGNPSRTSGYGIGQPWWSGNAAVGTGAPAAPLNGYTTPGTPGTPTNRGRYWEL